MHQGKGKCPVSVGARAQITSGYLGKEHVTMLACVTLTEERRDVVARKQGQDKRERQRNENQTDGNSPFYLRPVIS